MYGFEMEHRLTRSPARLPSPLSALHSRPVPFLGNRYPYKATAIQQVLKDQRSVRNQGLGVLLYYNIGTDL